MSRTVIPDSVKTIGIDPGKNTFHLVGLDARGGVTLRKKVSRFKVAARLANLPCCLIGIESGLATHDVARELAALGHDVKQVPPAYAKPFRQAHKNDFRDALAVAEAGGDGYCLPSHVKEMEAESYAHQAFRRHGMTLPSRLSAWGRSYVGTWIAKDRVAGIAIDPRAEAYAKGLRSPYEPLRMTPLEWQHLGIAGRLRMKARKWSKVLGARPLVQEALHLLPWVIHDLCFGTTAAFFAISALQIFYPDVVIIPKRPDDVTVEDLLIGYIGGLLWTNAAVLWRSITR